MHANLSRYLLAGAVAWAIMEPFALRARRLRPPGINQICSNLDVIASLVVATIAFVILPLAYLPWFFLRKWLKARQVRPLILSLAYPALAMAIFAVFFSRAYADLDVGEAAIDFTNRAYLNLYFDLWSATWPSIFAGLCFFVIMDSEG